MNHLKASLALAVALVALGTAQARAEMITIDASALGNGTNVTTIDSTVSGLPDAHLYPRRYTGYTTGYFNYQTIIDDVGGGVLAFAGVRQGFPSGDEFGAHYAVWADDEAQGVSLRVDFVDDKNFVDLGGYGDAPDAPNGINTGTYSLVPYVEVFFRSNDINGDKGELRAYNSDGELLGTSVVDLSTGTGLTGKATYGSPSGPNSIAYVELQARDLNTNILITGIRYGTGDPIPAVPEPASCVTFCLGCLVLWGIRKR